MTQAVMDFKDVSDLQSHVKYCDWFDEQSYNDREAIKVKMHAYLEEKKTAGDADHPGSGPDGIDLRSDDDRCIYYEMKSSKGVSRRRRRRRN